MQLNQYPALSQMESFSRELSLERALWGKVNGARSDFRWIARSGGFQGHKHGIEKALLISAEERPHKCPFWRRSEDFYYAVSCYPSRAKDAAGRSGFLEKQIIECRADSIPAALAALVLLPLVTGFQDDLATSHTGDARWDEPSFCLPDLQPFSCSVTDGDLQAAIEKGLNELTHLTRADLGIFFQQVNTGCTPAFLALERPLAPEALAVSLLPFSRDKADRLNLGGWIPSARTDAESLRNWDGLGCDSRLAPKSSFSADDDNDHHYGRRMVQVLLGLHPSVQQILDFADGPERWSDTVPRAISDFLNSSASAKAFDLEQIKQAIPRVMREMEQNSGLPKPLEEARQTQMRSKVNIVRAAYLLLSPTPIADHLELVDQELLKRVLKRWAENYPSIKLRIDPLLSQLQNAASPG